MDLLLRREPQTSNDTVTGELLHSNGAHICYTLEDTRRPPGVKIPGETCIPAGRYKCSVSRSSRFGRDMVMLYNCSNGYELRAEGVSFKGIRIHGGNKAANTHGCVLVAYNKLDAETIQGTAETEVTKLVQDAIARGEEVWLSVKDA